PLCIQDIPSIRDHPRPSCSRTCKNDWSGYDAAECDPMPRTGRAQPLYSWSFLAWPGRNVLRGIRYRFRAADSFPSSKIRSSILRPSSSAIRFIVVGSGEKTPCSIWVMVDGFFWIRRASSALVQPRTRRARFTLSISYLMDSDYPWNTEPCQHIS